MTTSLVQEGGVSVTVATRTRRWPDPLSPAPGWDNVGSAAWLRRCRRALILTVHAYVPFSDVSKASESCLGNGLRVTKCGIAHLHHSHARPCHV